MTDSAASPPARPEEEYRFPCDNCGADFRYDPGAGKLVCDHCGNEAALEDDGGADPWGRKPIIEELDFQAAIRDQLPRQEMEETRVSSCPSCGAQVQFDAAVHAAECPFCATPVVTDTGTHRHIKPAAVIPFQLDERTAREAMTKWLGRLWFAPSGLQEYARKGRKLEGIYVPYWTYDAQTDSDYRGQRGTVYYVNARGPDGKTVRQQKIRWNPVSGRVARFFDDVLVLASRSLPKRFTDALAPWALGALTPYEPEYLAGFRAEGYTVELEEGMVEARSIMDAQIARDIRADIGGDRQRISGVQTRLSRVTFKHILLPVWMAAYKYNGKSYRFVVNGQTGKVQGERPWSALKIAIAVIVVALILGVAAYLYVQAEQGGTAAVPFNLGTKPSN